MTKKVTFTLPAQIIDNATAALLLGDFNNWDVNSGSVMTPQKDGSLKTTVSLEYGKTYQYRYLLNNGTWINDENAAEFVPEYQIKNCVITVPEKKVAVKKAIVREETVTASKKTATKKAPKVAAKEVKTAENKVVAKKKSAKKQ